MDSIFVFYYFSLHIISAGPEWQMRWLYSRRERTGLLPQKIENEERKIKIALCRFSGLFYLSFFPPPSPFSSKKGKKRSSYSKHIKWVLRASNLLLSVKVDSDSFMVNKIFKEYPCGFKVH